MPRYKDLTGQKFGRLTVQCAANKGRRTAFLCECECGNEVVVLSQNLINGHTKSCGCLYRETRGAFGDDPKIRSVYYQMKGRCCNPRHTAYKNYGGRGISICDEWRNDYFAFLKWATEAELRKGGSIDRIDNDKGYSPENCRVADYVTQNNNRRNNRHFAMDGRTMTQSQWEKEIRISQAALSARHRRGWTDEKVLTTPIIDTSVNITFIGVTKRLYEWCNSLNLNYNTVWKRIYRHGWSIERAFNTPSGKRGA